MSLITILTIRTQEIGSQKMAQNVKSADVARWKNITSAQ